MIWILSVLLLLGLASGIALLHSNRNKEVEKLSKKTDDEIIEELSNVSLVVWICFLGGFLLTANYAITYFSGSSLTNIQSWGFYHWGGAIIGLVVTTAITSAQKVLYSANHQSGTLVTALILTFVVLSEIGSPIEKEEMKMHEASLQSETYKVVIKQIEGGVRPALSSFNYDDAIKKLANHRFELKRCSRYKGDYSKNKCETYENKKIAEYSAIITADEARQKNEREVNKNHSQGLIQQALNLEHNEDNHSGLIKFIRDALGTTALNAMMLTSLILVVAFEIAFHFVASREGELKAALSKSGNINMLLSSQYKQAKKVARFKQKTEKLKESIPSSSVSLLALSGANSNYQPTSSFAPKKPKATPPISTPPGKVSEQKNRGGIKSKNTPPKNLTGKVQEPKNEGGIKSENTPPKNLTGKVQEPENEGGIKTESDTYILLKSAVQDGLIAPTIPQAKKYLSQQNPKLGSNQVQRQKLAEKAYQKMLKQGVIKINPDWTDPSCGRAKYVLADKNQIDSFNS